MASAEPGRRHLLVAVVCVAVLVVGVAASARPTATPGHFARHHAATVAACPGLEALDVYDLGPTFAGDRAGELRPVCDPPRRRGDGSVRRAFSATTSYGTCEPEGDDGGCSPSATVQLFPSCRRDLAATRRLRGVPARVADPGLQVELRTGGTRVVVVTTSAARTRAAVRALRSDTVVLGARLPPPATGTRRKY